MKFRLDEYARSFPKCPAKNAASTFFTHSLVNGFKTIHLQGARIWGAGYRNGSSAGHHLLAKRSDMGHRNISGNCHNGP